MAAPVTKEKRYTASTLLNFLDISRNTLRYYEQLGVIAPARNAKSQYRLFSDEDALKIIGCNILRNAGYSLPEARQIQDEAQTPQDFLDACIQENELQILRHEAMRESFSMMQDVCNDVSSGQSAPRVSSVDPWLLFYDNCENGSEHFAADQTQATLLREMPIASFGRFFETATGESRYCRAIPQRYAALFPDAEASASRRVGGCACVVLSCQPPTETLFSSQSISPSLEAIRAYAEKRRLSLEEHGFSIRSIPICGVLYSRVCVPIRLQGRADKRRIKQLLSEH